MENAVLPIDIQAQKVLNWLISRRHVSKDWLDHIQLIRKKVSNAIQDMPEHKGITKLLSGTYINYYHCLKIVEILQETEKDSRNIFGWYSSQRMKDWKEIVRLYEKHNIGLAEAAQMLVRNVSFEVPSLQQQIANCSRIQKECDRKEAELLTSQKTALAQYCTSCEQIGIKGDKVKKELLSLLQDLPQELQKIAKNAKCLQDATEYYTDFISYVIPGTSLQSCLPMLKFVIERGDATVYEWKYREAPLEIRRSDPIYEEEHKSTGVDVIDCDDTEALDVELTTGDIDWGSLDAGAPDEDARIDCNITEADLTVSTADIVVESSGIEGGVASGEEAESVLLNRSTRNQFINELVEMKAFLTERHSEMTSSNTLSVINPFVELPLSVQSQGPEVIAEYLRQVESILSCFTSPKMQHQFMISISPKYVDRMVSMLENKLKQTENVQVTLEKVCRDRVNAREQAKKLESQLKMFIARTRELQEDIRRHISTVYKNHPVNIMGGVMAFV